jgi:hypothetical protein
MVRAIAEDRGVPLQSFSVASSGRRGSLLPIFAGISGLFFT